MGAFGVPLMALRRQLVLAALVALAVLGGAVGGAVVAFARHPGPPVGEPAPPLDLPLVKGQAPRFSLGA